MNKISWYFSIEEEGSFHESRHYKTRQACIQAAKWYVLDYRNHSYPETLEIKRSDLIE